MKTHLLVVALILAALGAFASSRAFAQPADGPPLAWTSPADAGPAAGVTDAPAAPLPDPTEDPSGFFVEAKRAYQAGSWTLFVALLMFGLARAGVWAATKFPSKWLSGWRLRGLVTASGVLGSVVVSLAAGGEVGAQALIGAIATAVVLYLKPEAPPKKKETLPPPIPLRAR